MLAETSATPQPAPSRALVISSNLDALLEHEERVRGQAPPSPQVLSPPASPIQTVRRSSYPVGLPPPPRGNKQPKSPKSPGYDSQKVIRPNYPHCHSLSRINDNSQESLAVQQPGVNLVMVEEAPSSSSTNPYINPAPTLVELGHGKELEEIKKIEADGGGELGANHSKEGCQIDGCDGEFEVGMRPSCLGEFLEQRPHATSQRSHLRAVSLLVDKRLNRCRNIVDLFSDDMSRRAAGGEHFKNLSSHPRRLRQTKRKPKLTTKLQYGTGTMAYALDDNVVLDIRRYSNDFIDITNNNNAWRHRPLNSHAASRRASSDSSSSGSTSTIGPRTQSLHVTHPRPSQDTSRHSFIEFFSPTTPDFPLPSVALPDASNMLLSRTSSDPPTDRHNSSSSRTSKSSTPKTVFSIPTSFKSPQVKSSSRGSSPHQSSSDKREPPPTTNFLDMDERADLVKKSRKLTRVFGETPGGDMLSTQESSHSTVNKISKSRRNRSKKETSRSTPLPLDSEQFQHLYTASRRHSIPVTPDEFSESFNQSLFQSATYKARLGLSNSQSSDYFGQAADAHRKLGSRVSFIDLSDEDVDEEALSPITFATNSTEMGSRRPPSPSQLSLYEAMTPEQRAEEERRRKREKLAKLHRFLGSRVPADLVLGADYLESSLPPIQPSMPAEESEGRTQWLRRRRSSSAGALPSWSDDVDRMKEELNDKEKAINVRRAQKMEKMFGVAPPQTLYHTRHSPSPSVPPEIYLKRSKPPPKPSFGGFIPPGEVPSPTYQQRNPNRSSYIKHRSKKNDRPSTAESSRRLLAEGPDCYSYDESPIIRQTGLRTSLVYHHYQHSLKSLSDILDRDDKESLAELHQYLNNYGDSSPTSSPREMSTTKDRRLSNTSSIKSERRRSLPARTSMLSIASELSITTPKAEVSDFQVRRRRAAKLTQFFGVNYRELINDVLESLETGLEHERKRGTLRAEEVEDLLERLRKIKTNRKGFF